MKKVAQIFLTIIICLVLFTASYTEESSETAFSFLGKITWNSTVEEIDKVMSEMGINRHSAYSFWEGREMNEGKNDQFLPYTMHNIYGGSGNLINFTTGANREGLEEISIEYEASTIGFKNVFSKLCDEYGESYRSGMLKFDSIGRNMSAFIWEPGDAYIIFYVSDFSDGGSGLFNRAEKGMCGFGINICHSSLPDNFVYSD